MIDLIDISNWNEINDWDLVANSVSGVLMKTSQNTWEDFSFRNNYKNARSKNLPIGLWHFYQPNVSYVNQVKAYLNIYNSLPIKHRPMLDCEEINYYYDDNGTSVHVEIYPPSKSEYTKWIRGFLQEVENSTGLVPMIYTRKSFWDQWIERSNEWNHYPLWVANYGATKPALPLDWTDWFFWQTGQFNCPGISKPVDHDVYRGTPEEVRLFLDGVDSIEIVPNWLKGKVISVNGVNVRKEPNTNNTPVTALPYGTEVRIVNISAPKETWGQLENGYWVALKYNGTELVKLV
jgi:GH25 family lysozyme M1 (1,4-beta-N-acetylmuramidase)